MTVFRVVIVTTVLSVVIITVAASFAWQSLGPAMGGGGQAIVTGPSMKEAANWGGPALDGSTVGRTSGHLQANNYIWPMRQIRAPTELAAT